MSDIDDFLTFSNLRYRVIMRESSQNKKIIIWLYCIAIMVFSMVLIGGITRLTDSGLSIVDWKPIVGAIPPMNELEWETAFNKYKAFPEFKIQNNNMDLEGFKSIFFWEWFHRLFGRLIGLVFLVPYIFFKFKKAISTQLNKKLILLFVLGGLQGLMGWYMVMSGLVNKPDVSHYRLAAHLSLAFLIIGGTLWTVLGIKYPKRVWVKTKKIRKLLLIFFVVLCVQIIYGAFVAGLDAGLTHNTFPKMGRSWIPLDVTNSINHFLSVFENAVVVQFIHRVIAWILLLLGITIGFKLRSVNDLKQKKSLQLMLSILAVQFMLGVATLLSYVSVSIASIHQIGACLLLLLCVRSMFFTFTDNSQTI